MTSKVQWELEIIEPLTEKTWGHFMEWFARGQGIWRQSFEKCQISTPSRADLTLWYFLGALTTTEVSRQGHPTTVFYGEANIA